MTGDFAALTGLDNFKNAFTNVYESRYVAGVVAGMKLQELVESGTLTPETQPNSFTADGKVKIGYVGATTMLRLFPATLHSSWACRAFTPMLPWKLCTPTPGSISTRKALLPKL